MELQEDGITAANNPLWDYGRITVKIGSALVADPVTGGVNRRWLDSLAADVDALRANGREIVIVSSGAIALGRRLLRLDKATLTLEQSQAAAAVGQIALSRAWEESLGEFGIVTGQILITPNITEERATTSMRERRSPRCCTGAAPIINRRHRRDGGIRPATMTG